jgi:hypothetical protein
LLSLFSPFSVAVHSFSPNQPNLPPGKGCLYLGQASSRGGKQTIKARAPPPPKPILEVTPPSKSYCPLSLSIKRLLPPSLPSRSRVRPAATAIGSNPCELCFSTLGTALDLRSCSSPLHHPCRDSTDLGSTIVVPSGALPGQHRHHHFSPSLITFPTFTDLVVSNPSVPFPLHGFLSSSLGLYTTGSSSVVVSCRYCTEEGSALSHCGAIKLHRCCTAEGAALSCSCAGDPCHCSAEDSAILTVAFWVLC